MFLYSKWLELDLATRIKIGKQFNILKGPTHVSNNMIKDDGFNVKDIEKVLTISTLQSYLDSKETNIDILWQNMVDKVEGRISTVTAFGQNQEKAKDETHIAIPVKKRGRPKKIYINVQA